MKSIRAASAVLAAGLLCNVASAGFPNSSLGGSVPAQSGSRGYSQVAQATYGAIPPYQPAPETVPPPGHYGSVANPYFQAMNNPWTGPSVVGASNACCPTWFGSVYGLIMTRADDDPFYFGVSDTDPTRLYLRNTEASDEYAGGIEARIGRTFDCCRWGLELAYWGLFPNEEYASVTAPNVTGMLMSTLDYSSVWAFSPDLATGAPATDYTDDLQMIQIRRDYDVHNVEVNILSGPMINASPGCASACGSNSCVVGDGCYAPPVFRPRFNVGWGLGVRYFKFDENLFIAMDRADDMIDFPDMPNNDELFHEVDVENNLVGVQLILDADYCLTKRFAVDVGTKFGIYGNHMNHYQRIYNDLGPAYVLPATPTDFTVGASDDDVAFLGEIRAGVGYMINKHLRLTGGYRAVAVTGVATATDQLEQGRVMSALWKVSDIERTSDLLLHGAYAGLDFAW